MKEEQKLRKECLIWAFKTRELTKVNHMEVTNVAHDYFDWITHGTSQRSLMLSEIQQDEDQG